MRDPSSLSSPGGSKTDGSLFYEELFFILSIDEKTLSIRTVATYLNALTLFLIECPYGIGEQKKRKKSIII